MATVVPPPGFFTQSEAQRLLRGMLWKRIEDKELDRWLRAIYDEIKSTLRLAGESTAVDTDVDVVIKVRGLDARLIGKFLIASGFNISMQSVSPGVATKFTISLIDMPEYLKN